MARNDPNRILNKQWNTLFLNLYKKTKQKESFDIRYRFLHFAQPTAIKLKEIRQVYTDTICPRCGEHKETHEHWLFSCKSQKLLMYLHSVLRLIHTETNSENKVTECLIKPLIQYVDKFQVASELYEIYLSVSQRQEKMLHVET